MKKIKDILNMIADFMLDQPLAQYGLLCMTLSVMIQFITNYARLLHMPL